MPEYIDQRAAIAAVKTLAEMTGDKGREKGLRAAIVVLSKQKAADVEPVRHGRWLLKHIGAGHMWECSCCHKRPCIYITEDTAYCPNCGAKMDEEV